MNFHIVNIELEVVRGIVETRGTLEKQSLKVILPIKGILTFRELSSEEDQDILRSFIGKAKGAYIHRDDSLFLAPKMDLHCLLDKALPNGTAEVFKKEHVVDSPDLKEWPMFYN